MGWLDNLENGGEFSGTTNKGFNYNGAWGGPAQNGKTFYNDYINSPKYKERLSLQNYDNPDKVVNDRTKHLSKTKLKVLPNTGQFTEKNTGSFYHPETNTVDYDPFDLTLYPGSTAEDIKVHEYSHAVNALKPESKNNLTLSKKEAVEINKRNKNKEEHEKNAWEAKADMDVLRYHLQKDKIYNTGTEDFTIEKLKDAKKKYKKNETIKRFFDRFSDKDAVYLMNSIAENDLSEEQTFAQNGASMPGSVGFSYARTGAPSNGKYAKKTMPSAQDGLTLYDPEKNPEWRGLDERTATIRLNNATKSNTQRAIQVNQNILNNIASFNESKQNYINQQKELVNQYTSGESSIKELATIAKDKYNFDLEKEAFAKLSPREMVSRVMVDRANAAIASGKGYPLSQDPKNEMTCINGVCTAASEAGVDFSPLSGKLGVVKDARGKDIPQYNVTWAKDDNYTKAGFERVPVGQAPQPGDFAQYEDKRDDSHMDVEHMELVKNVLPTGYESFNNYNQTNNPVPGSGNSIRNYEPGESKKIKEFPDTYYFRLKDEVANKIVHTDPQYKNILDAYEKFKVSDDYKTYAEKKAFLEANKGRYEKAKEYLSKNTPKSVTSLKSGGVIKDDAGYWNPNNWGKTVEIGSNQITMKGVNQPLIGVSDTGDVQYMEPGKDYKFKGKKVTEHPIAQNGSNVDPVKAFSLEYINSPKYKERLTNSGYKNPDEVIKKRGNNVKASKVVEQDGKPNVLEQMWNKVTNTPYSTIGSAYDPEINTIIMDNADKTKKKLQGIGMDAIKAHEFGHSELHGSKLNYRDENELFDRQMSYQLDEDEPDDLREREEIKARGRRTDFTNVGHDLKPDENKSDLNGLRYLLKKEKIYDAGKETFTKEHLKKVKPNFYKNRLLKNYKEKDLIWLMNNVADMNSSNSSSSSAKDGAELTKLDQLTNFTNYNKPQPGGWLDNL